MKSHVRKLLAAAVCVVLAVAAVGTVHLVTRATASERPSTSLLPQGARWAPYPDAQAVGSKQLSTVAQRALSGSRAAPRGGCSSYLSFGNEVKTGKIYVAAHVFFVCDARTYSKTCVGSIHEEVRKGEWATVEHGECEGGRLDLVYPCKLGKFYQAFATTRVTFADGHNSGPIPLEVGPEKCQRG